MRTWLINTEGENAFINYQFSLNTEIMTTNDIVDISKLGFSTPVVSATAFINFSSLPKTNLKPSALQIQLASKNMVFHNAKSSSQNGPAHHCDIVTCQSDGQGYCTAQESQQTGEEWFCLFTSEDKMCPKRVSNELASTTINTDVQDDSLYNFRDNYLASRVKGAVYINRYYQLSDMMEVDSIDLSFSISTINIIENKILPIVNSLKANPTSTNILYSIQDRDDIVNYLLLAKDKFADPVAKGYIDQIINDVIFLANKSANDVNTYLSIP